VEARTIASFRTNLYSRTPQDDIVITVTAISAAEACSGLKAVQEALMPLAIHAKIRFEVP
jgi:hypothetical protein